MAGALVFAPLAFGAVEPWACSVLAVLSCTALAAALIRVISAADAQSMRTPLLVPAGLAILLVVLQYVPWPAGLLELLSPKAVAGHRAAAASVGAAPASWLRPSLYPHATRNALILLCSYVALFLAACDCARTRKQVSSLAALIVATGFGVSLLGILQNLSGTRKLYWWRPLSHGGALFGPFVSRNQFAAYAAVCLFVGLGLLLARGAHAAGSLRRWREGIARRSTQRAHQNFLIGFAAAVTGAAVLWSLSRGGVISMMLALAGVLIALGAAGAAEARRRRGLYVSAVVVVILGWVSYLGWEPVVTRLASLQEVAQNPRATWRWTMFQDAARMGSDFPLLGTGAGTFVSVYPLYRTLPTRAITVSPHDEYVHIFAETGLPGLGVLALAAALFYGGLFRALARRRNPYVRGLLVGALGAPLAVTFHSVVDFPMRSPAIAATLAVVVALLYKTAHLKTDANHALAEQEDGPPEPHHPRHGRAIASSRTAPDGEPVYLPVGAAGRTMLAFAAVGIAWLVACSLALDPLREQLDDSFIRRVRQHVAFEADGVLPIVEASEQELGPDATGNAALRADLSDLAMDAAAAVERPTQRLLLTDRALKLRTAAVLAEPMNGQHPFWLAAEYLSFGRSDLAWIQAQRACRLLPNDPYVRAYLAEQFRAYGWTDLAGGYLEDAARLAQARDVPEALPLIQRVRRRLAEQVAASPASPPGKKPSSSLAQREPSGER